MPLRDRHRPGDDGRRDGHRLMRRALAVLRRLTAASGQCSVCGGIFDDWNGGICAACTSTRRT